MRITGATRLYGMVGDPIAQVRSPEVFNERFAAAGVDAVLIPLHVHAERFDATMRALMALGNLDGLLVTVPYKVRAAAFADRLGDTARLVGAVNALRRERDGVWFADMFDGLGFVRAVERKGETLRGRRAVLLGAGGAGSAIGCELARCGVASIAIMDPQASRAAALARTLAAAFPDTVLAVAQALPADVDMIVNASTVGMRPEDGLPIALGALDARTLVGDVIVSSAPTPMVRHAMEHGCPYVTGRDMHAGQVDALLDFLAQAR